MSVFRGAGGGGAGATGLAHDGSSGDPLVVTPAGAGGPVLVASNAIMVSPAIVLDTAAYAAGDLLFDFVELPNVLTEAGRTATLQSILLEDKADTGVTLSFFFARSLVDMGVVNAAPTITDADSFSLLGGPIQIAAGDWYDLGSNRCAGKDNIGRMVEAAAGTSIYVAAVITTGGTAGTFAASDLRATFGFWKN